MPAALGPVAIVGGTGHLGLPLARRLHRAGERVLIGSRDAARAESAAEDGGLGRAAGRSNAAAVREAAVVVIAVPYEGHEATLRLLAPDLAGKPVLETTVPYDKATRSAHQPDGLSAAERAQSLAPGARIVAGFHTVSALMLADVDRPAHGDVLLCGDDAGAKDIAASLVRAIGMRPVDAGPLRSARVLEQLAVLLLGLNRRYRRKDLGITVAGLE
ncbi:MAG TPA: NADPH-dependent F420 reductase [bacterium]|nr:NADPH-dependent F420 reductase [bacterium]